MAVKIRVEIHRKGFCMRCNALVNSGFCSDEPQLIISERLFRNKYPAKKITTRVVRYETAGGKVDLTRIDGAAVRIVKPKKSRLVRVAVILSPFEQEALINDYLASELKIQLLDLRKGLWRYATDHEGTVYKSV